MCMTCSPRTTQRTQTTRGFSVVEALVAITVLLISVTAAMTSANRSQLAVQESQLELVATALAQEGVEAVISLHRQSALEAISSNSDASWDWYNTLPARCKNVDRGCGVDFSRLISGNVDQASVVAYGGCNTGAGNDGCRLYFDASKNRSRYFHDDPADPNDLVSAETSPFRRVVRVHDGGFSDEHAIIEVEVFWDSRLQSGERSVKLTSSVSNFVDRID